MSLLCDVYSNSLTLWQIYAFTMTRNTSKKLCATDAHRRWRHADYHPLFLPHIYCSDSLPELSAWDNDAEKCRLNSELSEVKLDIVLYAARWDNAQRRQISGWQIQVMRGALTEHTDENEFDVTPLAACRLVGGGRPVIDRNVVCDGAARSLCVSPSRQWRPPAAGLNASNLWRKTRR